MQHKITQIINGEPKNVINLKSYRTTIGRAEDNDIPLPEDKQVSRRHAQIEINEQGIVLTDLNSTNGTYVNGNRIVQTVLSLGDQIVIGENIFIVGGKEDMEKTEIVSIPDYDKLKKSSSVSVKPSSGKIIDKGKGTSQQKATQANIPTAPLSNKVETPQSPIKKIISNRSFKLIVPIVLTLGVFLLLFLPNPEEEKAKKHYEKGIELARAGNYEEAIKRWKLIVQKRPQSEYAKKSERAIKKAEAEIEKQKQKVAEYIKLGDKLLKEDNLQLALEQYQLALKIDSLNADAKKGIELLKQREEILSHLSNGKALFNEGEYDKALEEMVWVLQKDPNNSEAKNFALPLYKKKANDYFKVAKYQEALTEWENAQALNPTDTEIAKNIEKVKAILARLPTSTRPVTPTKPITTTPPVTTPTQPNTQTTAPSTTSTTTTTTSTTTTGTQTSTGETTTTTTQTSTSTGTGTGTGDTVKREILSDESKEKAKAAYITGIRLEKDFGDIEGAKKKWREVLQIASADPTFEYYQKALAKLKQYGE